MATVKIESLSTGKSVVSSVRSKWSGFKNTHFNSMFVPAPIRASQSMEDKNKVYKELAMEVFMKNWEFCIWFFSLHMVLSALINRIANVV
ncbi:hypothetical protein ACHQM5_011954 [Ranunculus cassubicifolius]